MNEHLFKLIHAISGYTVFAIAILQFSLKKSGMLHMRLGHLYLIAWFGIVVTGALIGHVLITFLGILGLYFAYTGAVFAHVKSDVFPNYGKAIVWFGFASSIGLMIMAIVALMNGNYFMVIIGFFFCFIFGYNTAIDLKEFVFGKKHRKGFGKKQNWFFEHFTRMIVSFIAAMTAFSAIQGIFGEGSILNWLLPTFIGTTCIFITVRHYKKKMKITE